VIALVDYGAGNLRSVELALERVGAACRRVADPTELVDCSGIVLPGVGAAGSAMRELDRRGLVEPLAETSVPLLGVCLGMQLLTASSDEADERVACLARLDAHTRRFPGTVRVPHVGWSRVRLTHDPLFRGLGEEAWFYFLHSHRVPANRYAVATADHGGPFCAAARRGSAVGVQFHPEKSGAAGLRVLANFCESVEGGRC
jgi:glutamine amidotransferase